MCFYRHLILFEVLLFSNLFLAWLYTALTAPAASDIPFVSLSVFLLTAIGKKISRLKLVDFIYSVFWIHAEQWKLLCKTYSKVWYSLCVCFIWHILCEMWQQFLLFILVFISPYFITTWRQFLQQVMSKLHWFAEKNKISCKTNFLVDFIFPEIWLNLWYGEWCWRVRNSILDVKQTDI